MKNPTSQSGAFNPRVLVAFALCSLGVLLGMFSLAATLPGETTHANTSGPPNPANYASTSGSNANHLPPGVPHPPGAQFSVNGQGDPSRSSSPAGPQTPANASAQSIWSIFNSPNSTSAPTSTTDNSLVGITCVSASDCWAVGSYYTGAGGDHQTLIQRWNGTSWAIVNSPNIMRENILQAVTCTSASDCWAVGYYYTGNDVQIGIFQALIIHWDGTSWAIVNSPNPVTPQSNYLSSVTCTSASNCWAVGTAGNQTLIEHWDGTSWGIVSSPNVNTDYNILHGVACASASECWAVGTYVAGSAAQTLIERWDGSAWAIVSSPNTSTAEENVLQSVTCVSASDCWAVGQYYVGTSDFEPVYQTLIQRWDGTSWTIVTSPNKNPDPATCILNGQLPGCPQSNYLLSVTCLSGADCFAVGYTNDGSGKYQTLIERWDGTSWAVVTSPNTSTTERNFLPSVTCVSGTADCWAVGTGANRTLIQRWDGTAWAIVTSPNSPPTWSPNYLVAVTCVSASDCWAVGSYDDVGIYRTLIQRWDGTAWTIVSSPNIGLTQHNLLSAVTCVSGSNCWAVGNAGNQTLIQHWNGTAWAVVSSPSIGTTQENVLYGVTCTSASNCWAVGYYADSDSIYRTLIERWDGTAWAIVSSPNVNTNYHSLFGVTCVSASDCWAVGKYNTDVSG